MAINKVQDIRRVSRVGQREKTATIKPVNMTSQIEEAIHDRQGARRAPYNLVESPKDNSQSEDGGKEDEEDLADNIMDENGNVVGGDGDNDKSAV